MGQWQKAQALKCGRCWFQDFGYPSRWRIKGGSGIYASLDKPVGTKTVGKLSCRSICEGHSLSSKSELWLSEFERISFQYGFSEALKFIFWSCISWIEE
jgi:hypothetical protein